MRLVFAGTPKTAADTLAAIVAAGHDVVGVITRPPAPSGRGRKPRPSAVSELANDLALDLFDPQSMRRPNVFGWLKEKQPELAIVVAYGGLVPPNLLTVPEFGWVNIHYSLLPRWRGAAPVAHAIAHGDKTTGVSVFELEVGLDTGPVLAEVEVPIGDRVTTGQLLHQLTMAGADLITEVLTDFDSYSAAAKPQSTTGVSFAPRLQVMDAKIRWANSVTEADRWLRAVTPSPGGWSTFAGGRVNISPFKEIAADNDLLTSRLSGVVDGFEPRVTAPGQMLVGKSEVWVACKSGGALLDMVQPAGKNLMSAIDWVRGLRGQSLQFS